MGPYWSKENTSEYCSSFELDKLIGLVTLNVYGDNEVVPQNVQVDLLVVGHTFKNVYSSKYFDLIYHEQVFL